MALSKQYPGSVTRDEIKRECPTFGDKVCPFTKLAVKGAAGKCPAFEKECPFANCMTVGQFQAKLGEMREGHKNTPSGEAASLQYLRAIHRTAKDKEVDVGSACPFFQSKGGCPFAKDTSGKAIFSPDYIVTPNSVTLNDTMFKCPAFGKGMCPYAILVTKCKGLAGNCPAFKEGCPFKNCKSVGEFVEKLTQMRDQMKNSTKGKGAAGKLPVPWRTNRSNVCRFPGAYHAAAYRLCRTLTEIEHRDDGAFKRYLPGPKTGGFVRGSFIAWRRHERVRDIEVVKDSIRELYDFEEVVGEGGFGKVSRARHRRTGEVVAIKTISKSKLGDEEALQLEVAFLKLSDHPNTVRYYETFEDATDIHLVMEMCSGGSLAQLLQNAHDDFGPGVSEDELKRISLQMLQGIAYCHAHSVAHRDIKPQNLLFSCGAPKNGSAIPISCSGHGDAPLKLVDFGIAGVVRNDRPEKRLLTKCAGTLGYMAPEVFGNKPYDGRSADLFSIGAVMHHMVVGVPPSWKAALNAYEFSGKMRYKQLSEDCQSLLEHLLHEVPEMRPTAAEALQHPWFDAEHSVSGGEDDMASLLERCFTRMNDFCQRSPLQKTIMYSTVAFAGLHNHHMEQLRVAFLFADRGNRGVAGGQGISCFEFVELGRKYSRFKPQELRQIFACANVSRNGKLSYCEWLAACAPAKWYGDTCNAERAFDTLDVKRNGFVGASDLCQLLPHALDKESIQEEILCSFPTGDGRLSFQDFVACSG